MQRVCFVIICVLLMSCSESDRERVDVLPLSPTTGSISPNENQQPPPTAVPTTPADGDWQRLVDGVEFREIAAGVTTVQIVRIDPTVRRMSVAYDAADPGRVSEWALALKPMMVINGGYFDEQGRATALTIYDGVSWGESYAGFGGMLAVDTAGTVSLRSLREQPYSSDETLAQALQSAPMLVLHGEAVPQPNDDGKRSRRSVVASDGEGRIIVLACSWPQFSLTELSVWLVEQPLGIVNALNLDGGSSTGLALDTPDRSFIIDSLVRVPQVLVVE